MRLLLFSDLHCDTRVAERLVEMSEQVDVVVGAGDFATMRRGLQPMIDVLRAILRPSVVVAGNSESFDELSDVCRQWDSAHVLHGTSVTIAGQTFFGLGGAVPETPFGAWSYDLSEDTARQLLAECPGGAVMVTHSPPKGCVDRSSTGQSLGSVAILQALERVRPPLLVCGHIHESAGQLLNHEGTQVINAGPSGRVFELNR